MRRWGDGIYESEYTLDFVRKIAQFESRLSSLMASDRVKKTQKWLYSVLEEIELLLVFNHYDIGSNYLIADSSKIDYWYKIFFKVWDSAWRQKMSFSNELGDAEFRSKHRSIVRSYFEQLHITDTHQSDDNKKISLLSFKPPKYFPFFTYHNIYFTDYLMQIIWDSLDDATTATMKDIEQVWACADILGKLIEAYMDSPFDGIEEVNEVEKIYFKRWNTLLGDNSVPDPKNVLAKNVKATFKHLRDMIEKYNDNNIP